jgi:pimeloyl-ACP methyl ester carboxylesterase
MAASACAGRAAGRQVSAPLADTVAGDALIYGYADLGGYELAYLCRGEGTPAVIIEDALGVPALESGGWWDLMAEIAPLTRICVYDRAGLGLSGQAPAGPRTSQTAVEDLRTLLHAAQVPGPYVLVGHAVGGYHALLHASQHPGEMAGLVLINGYHPDQWTAFQALLPAEILGEPARLSRLRYLQAQPAANTEALDVFESAAQISRSLAGRLQPPLGDLPLVVITRSPESGLAPFMPPEISFAGGPVWQALQAELAALSSSGTQEWAEKGGHSLHLQEPELVVAAIRKVVEAARGPHD